MPETPDAAETVTTYDPLKSFALRGAHDVHHVADLEDVGHSYFVAQFDLEVVVAKLRDLLLRVRTGSLEMPLKGL